MASRVDHHTPTVWSGLFDSAHCAEPERFGFGGLEVVDGKVEVNLLWHRRIWPAWRAVIGHVYRREPECSSFHCDKGIAREGDFSSKKTRPKARERSRVGAIERDGSDSGDWHIPDINWMRSGALS